MLLHNIAISSNYYFNFLSEKYNMAGKICPQGLLGVFVRLKSVNITVTAPNGG